MIRQIFFQPNTAPTVIKVDPPKNIGFIECGYDGYAMNPFNMVAAKKARVFNVYKNGGHTSANGKKYIPNGYQLNLINKHHAGKASKDYSSYSELLTDIKKRVAFNVAIPDIFSFCGSNKMQHIQSEIDQYGCVLNLSLEQTECWEVLHQKNKHNENCFSDDFIKDVNALPYDYDEPIYSVFMHKYGTHYPTAITFGSEKSQMIMMSKDYYQQLITKCVQTKTKLSEQYQTIKAALNGKKNNTVQNNNRNTNGYSLFKEEIIGENPEHSLLLVQLTPMAIKASFSPIEELLSLSVFGQFCHIKSMHFQRCVVAYYSKNTAISNSDAHKVYNDEVDGKRHSGQYHSDKSLIKPSDINNNVNNLSPGVWVKTTLNEIIRAIK